MRAGRSNTTNSSNGERPLSVKKPVWTWRGHVAALHRSLKPCGSGIINIAQIRGALRMDGSPRVVSSSCSFEWLWRLPSPSKRGDVLLRLVGVGLQSGRRSCVAWGKPSRRPASRCI